jgi:transposase
MPDHLISGTIHYLIEIKYSCGRNNSLICRRCCSGASGAGWAGLVSVSSTCLTILVVVMAWSGEHRAYVVETYLKNAESVIAAQWLVRKHFRLGRNATVPDRKTILVWVANFRATGSALKKKSPGRPCSVRSPQNIQAVRQAIMQSPWRSAQKHAATMGMPERSVRRILHADLKFHPYKMMVVQELNQCNWVNRSDSSG